MVDGAKSLTDVANDDNRFEGMNMQIYCSRCSTYVLIRATCHGEAYVIASRM